MTWSQSITTILDLLALLYAFRSLQIARLVWRNWSLVRSGSFTREQKHLAGQASFFLAVPISVFFHELAHALAAWAFGGQVLEFHYRFFWGFVRSAGVFTPAQNWFIALAGTLGSLLFGLVLWLALRGNPSPSLRYFGLRSFRWQLAISIIYYPVFTLLGFYGDWRTIYDFNATPLLSAGTAAMHAGLLGLFWWANRRGWFEMASFQSLEEHRHFTELEAQAAASPHDAQLQLRLVDAYRQGGQTNLAERRLRDFLDENPDSAEGYLQLAAIQTQNKRQIPAQARKSAEKALSLGLSKPAAVAYANQLIGEYSLGVGNLDEAISRFDQGIAAAQSSGQPAVIARLFYSRAVAKRRKGQYQSAYLDVSQAIKLAKDSGDAGALARYQAELLTIENHAGRSLGPSSVYPPQS